MKGPMVLYQTVSATPPRISLAHRNLSQSPMASSSSTEWWTCGSSSISEFGWSWSRGLGEGGAHGSDDARAEESEVGVDGVDVMAEIDDAGEDDMAKVDDAAGICADGEGVDGQYDNVDIAGEAGIAGS